jgi:regulator of replication initiation timing
MAWFFSKKAEKKDLDILKEAVQTGFNSVKQDFNKTSTWIKHLNINNDGLKEEISSLHDELATLKEELESMKNVLSIVGKGGVFKQQQTVFNKQTPSNHVLNSVQTGVQTVFLGNLSTTERAIVFVLLKADMKLSYEDLAAMLGKRKTTIRGQVNTIKQKSEGLIEEIIGENNKKRVFIPDKMKESLLNTQKPRKVRKKQ